MRSLKGLSLAVLLILSCRAPFDPADYNPDWTDASHSGFVAPNYAVVFPEDSVNRIDITLGAATWTAIRKNMKALWGFDFGDNVPCCNAYPDDPDYFEATVKFNGKTWQHVGFRLKGNSSLREPWNTGVYKLPFRLKFDEFEDIYPEVWNQRFYGFKGVAMSANVFDDAMIRERLATELFRQGGVAAPHAVPYRVYIDFGNGLEYNGLYTMVELPEDGMLQDQFGESSGNVYKPESALQSFSIPQFPRVNNTESQDYSDIEALVKAINDTSLQRNNLVQWRANLEAVFNVEGYLKYLAVNNAIANWDAYGFLPHNYYLYNHSTKKMTWIPWDQNFAFTDENPPAIGTVPRNVVGVSMMMNEVESSWPLIRNIVDDAGYFARYRYHLANFSTGAFTQAKLTALIDKYVNMIRPYVVGPNGEKAPHTLLATPASFDQGVATLRARVTARRVVVEQFLR